MTDNNSGTTPGIHLDEDLAHEFNSALTNGNPVLVAYADASGQPHVSFRGTAQVYSQDQLALWAREPGGGLPTALASNPKLTLMYRNPNPEDRKMFLFYGSGHIESGEDVRKKVFDSSPEREQQADPDRKGVAIVVDLDLVEGRTADGPFKMSRS